MRLANRPQATDQRPQTLARSPRKWRVVFYLLFSIFYSLYITGCGPTYPKTKIKESIIRVCKNEYKIDVKVHTTGKTIAIYLPLPDLLDLTFAITKEAGEKINDVIMSVSRVALSTDAKFDFYCIIAHDIRIPEIQIIIIKSVDDVKRLLLNDVSRGEYANRMLIDMRLNPQAQKEHSIKEVFEKMNLDKKWQDQVMNDFFRSEPAVLGDIGYWNGRFYIKDISMAEFLAEQIANRVKVEFKENKKLADSFLIRNSKGAYYSRSAARYFRFEVLAEAKIITESKGDLLIPEEIFRAVSRIAGNVIRSYRFNDFDYIEILNQGDGRVLKISRDDLEALRQKKIRFEELL